jgi:hypothetical protein
LREDVAISEDDECWSIAESMVEVIELIRWESLKVHQQTVSPRLISRD